MQNETKLQFGFAQRRLPWLVAVGALILYGATLVTWVTQPGLAWLAKVGEWDWRLPFHAPLHYLLTYPLRSLSPALQLLALNGMAAVCSAAALGMLARCVSLLPHDRTKEQRQLERSDYSCLTLASAWLPPLLAALACGLQLTFWENAITGTGEAIDLLLFATILWCLLEYRIDEKDGRLMIACVLQGLGMTSNYAMVAFFPAFLIALVWIKGLPIFQIKVLVKLAVSGLVGLSLYLLFPLLHWGSDLTHLGFWEVLVVNLGFQKSTVLGFPRYLMLILALTSIVPVLFMGIRWPAHVGDTSAAAATLTRLMVLVVHTLFLGACTAVMFDPAFSPRRLVFGTLAFLPLYFLSALSIGYYAGYFLLVCGSRPVKSWERPSLLVQALNRVMVALVYALLGLVPVLLAVRNYPQLANRMGQEWHLYGEQSRLSLPEGPAVVLADDELRLGPAWASVARAQPKHPYIFIDASAMNQVAYHRWQHRRYGTLWPDTLAKRDLVHAIADDEAQQFVVTLAKTLPVYYLHFSFGYYFEKFYAKPNRSAFQLLPLPDNAITPPAVPAETLQSQDVFWSALYQNPVLQDLIRKMNRETQTTFPDSILDALARFYSTAYNDFGVQLQKAKELDKAALYFGRALAFNTNNPSAYLNLDFNRYLHQPKETFPAPSDGTQKRLAPFRGQWAAILGLNGPVDEPNSCFHLGNSLIQGNNLIQAAQQMLRSLELASEFFPARIALAGIYVKLNRPDDALNAITEVRKATTMEELGDETASRILEAEAWAHVLKNNLAQAEKILRDGQKTYPKENIPFSTLANIFLANNQRTNAVAVYQEQLRHQPNNVGAMVNLSAILIVLRQFQDATALLDKALAIDPKNLGALLNRAIAHLNSDRLSEARRDYETLLLISPQEVAAAVFGLGDVAWRQKNHAEAKRQYQHYLEIALPGAPETTLARQRLLEIERGTITP